MTLDEAFDALGRSGLLPVAAMQRVLDEWDDAAPRCLALLHGFVASEDLSEHTSMALFPILHMLGEKQIAAAFADLCALCADSERCDLVMGDGVTATLPRLLVSCFDGNLTPLQSLIAQAEVDEYVRYAALLALAYLAHAGRVPRTEAHAYLAGLFDTLQPQGEHFVWVGVVEAVGLLGFGALAGPVARVFERGFVDPTIMGLEHFQADLLAAREDPHSDARFEKAHVGLLGSAVTALQGWLHTDDDPAPVVEPYVNPLRNVGRNDPCPCGSGKKFKKCCLA